MKNKKTTTNIALFLMCLMISLPVAIAQETSDLVRGDPEGQARAVRDDIRQSLSTTPTSREDIIGEDIIINVDEYQPRVLRSNLLASENAFVYAVLSGTPTNPSITVPRIRNIAVRSAKVTTMPPDKPVRLGAIRHISPPQASLSYNNMGHLVVPITRIPRDDDMPDEIIVDVDARVLFDVSQGNTFGPASDVLVERSFDEWTPKREDHAYHDVYIHATEVKANEATFNVYDQNLNELVTGIKLRPGQTSRSIRRSGGYLAIPGASLFDRVQLQLQKIKARGNRVSFIVTRDGVVSTSRVSEGEALYPGSRWIVERVISGGDDVTIRLRGPKGREEIKAKITEEQQQVTGISSTDIIVTTENDITITNANDLQRVDRTLKIDTNSPLVQKDFRYSGLELNSILAINIAGNRSLLNFPSGYGLTIAAGTATLPDVLKLITDGFNNNLLNAKGHEIEVGIDEKINFVIKKKGTPSIVSPTVITGIDPVVDRIKTKVTAIKKDGQPDPTFAEYLNYTDVMDTIGNFISPANKRTMSDDTKNLLSAIIADLVAYYRTEVINYNRDLTTTGTSNTAKENYLLDNFDRAKELLQRLADETDDPAAAVTVVNPESTVDALQLSIQEYEKVVNKYPQLALSDAVFAAPTNVPIGFAAQKRIAEIYLEQGKTVEAATAYQKLLDLLNGYNETLKAAAESMIPQRTIERLINTFQAQDQEFRSITKTLDEGNGQIITAVFAGFEKITAAERSTATIQITNTAKSVNFKETFRENEYIINPLDQGKIPGAEYRWMLKEIRDDRIILERTYTDSEGNARTITKNIQLSDREGEAVNINSRNENVVVKLLDSDTKREAHVIIRPNTERAISNARFTLHIPIEKGLIDLPLFSDSIDEEINKTRELMQKLDEVLINVEKIHNYWKQFCFIVFGFLWAKSMLSGLGILGDKNAALARERTGESFRDVCAEEGIASFDKCVFEHQDKYEEMYEKSLTTINQIDSGAYKNLAEVKDLENQFGDKSELYDEDLKDLYYHKQFGDSPRAQQKYYEISSRLKKQALYTQFDNSYMKEGKLQLGELSTDDKNTLRRLVGGNPILHTRTDPPTNAELAAVLNNQGLVDRTNLVGQLRDELAHGQLEGHFDQARTAISDPTTKAYVENLRNTYLDPLGKRNRKILQGQIYSTAGKTGTPLGHDYYTFSHGTLIYLKKNTLGGVQGHDGNTYQVVKTSEDYAGDHEEVISFYESGRHKGMARSISLDSNYYAEIEYTTGRRIKNVYVFERDNPNAPLGTGQGYATLESALSQAKNTGNSYLLNRLQKIQSCTAQVNRNQGRYERGQKDVISCAGLGTYSVASHAEQNVRSECVDIYSPADCKLLFNACDPVICPPTRCNLDGNWEVENVVQTGLIGSAVLCLPNWGNPTIMPICITGIYAGLQNIRSILQSYAECLQVKKAEGVSVGICKKLQSFYMCDILWREAIAIFNIKGGLLGWISKNVFDGDKGGGEYASFKKSFENSVNGLEFFTQQYAKNTFIQFAGGSLPEIGAEVCRSAIFGKVPGIGSFQDRILQPESPPQFTATLDKAPYSDIPENPEVQYELFYHMYAGANEPITFSVSLRGSQDGAVQLPRVTLLPNRRLPAGEVASETVVRKMVDGYSEVCVNYASPTQKYPERCGFGKVTSDFGLNYVNDIYTASEAEKRITTAEDCTPQTSRLTSPQAGVGAENIARLGVGGFSSGLLQTGIIRQCSKYNPGVGGSEDKWAPVGTCWEGGEEEGRNLGSCWLYMPTAERLIKDKQRRTDFKETVGEVSQQVIKEADDLSRPIPGYVSEEEIEKIFPNAEAAIINGRYQEGVDLLRKVISSSFFNEQQPARAHMLIAHAYYKWGYFLQQQLPAGRNPTPPGSTVEPIQRIDDLYDDEEYAVFHKSTAQPSPATGFPAIVNEEDLLFVYMPPGIDIATVQSKVNISVYPTFAGIFKGAQLKLLFENLRGVGAVAGVCTLEEVFWSTNEADPTEKLTVNRLVYNRGDTDKMNAEPVILVAKATGDCAGKQVTLRFKEVGAANVKDESRQGLYKGSLHYFIANKAVFPLFVEGRHDGSAELEGQRKQTTTLEVDII